RREALLKTKNYTPDTYFPIASVLSPYNRGHKRDASKDFYSTNFAFSQQNHRKVGVGVKLKTNQGFALLITLVVVSVVLAIGLSLLFITTKQYLLAVTASESEKAFQAAQIGLECMRYHRAQPSTREKLLREDTSNWPPSLACAGVVSNIVNSNPVLSGGPSGVWMYKYQYRYNFNNSCIDTSLYMADYRETSSNQSYNITSQNEGLTEIECTAGTVCTIIFARGYNRPCDQFDSILTIQREITVEY
ncbi:MAG: pilus assembly PilX N-terminal domain-containing protein, partial [Candidatus Paceibacterota bacterium]